MIFRTRQYLGYHKNFLNDAAICEEVYELRFSKDFAYLDEFFGSGDGGGDGDDPGSVYEEVEVESLEEIEDIEVEGLEFEQLEVAEITALPITKYEKPEMLRKSHLDLCPHSNWNG